MTNPIEFNEFIRPGLLADSNLLLAREVAFQVRAILLRHEVVAAIEKAHQFGASSSKVQAVLLDPLEEIGFTSERRGLFKHMDVSGIRPDYFKPLAGGGILFEVERGKTIANNMDLLDVWKTHICQEAQHLFLLVPRIRVSGANKNQKVFASVQKRVGTFFLERTQPIDVKSVHLFGY